MSTLLRTGGHTTDLGPKMAVDGFFATITYRLEPDGRGSRFPLVMNRIYAGRLNPADVPGALRELQDIEAGLAMLPVARVVWSLVDLSRRDDRGLPVNHSAANVREYFVTTGGRPMIAALRDAVLQSRDRNAPLEVASSEAVSTYRGAWLMIAAGLIWTAVGYRFFRRWYFTSLTHTTSDDKGGVLIWPAGMALAAIGLFGLVVARYPALGEWFQRRQWLSVVLLLIATGIFIWLAKVDM